MTEKDFFAKHTRIGKKGDVDEYTHEREALATRGSDLSDDPLQTYVHRLKPYIKDELEMHNIQPWKKIDIKQKSP